MAARRDRLYEIHRTIAARNGRVRRQRRPRFRHAGTDARQIAIVVITRHVATHEKCVAELAADLQTRSPGEKNALSPVLNCRRLITLPARTGSGAKPGQSAPG